MFRIELEVQLTVRSINLYLSIHPSYIYIYIYIQIEITFQLGFYNLKEIWHFKFAIEVVLIELDDASLSQAQTL